MTASNRPERVRLMLWAAIAVAACGSYLVFLNAVPDYYSQQQDDPFTYIILAKSLAAGDGFPTKHWFPGLPLMLAALIPIVGLNFTLLKLAMVGVSALLALWSYWYYRELLAPTQARYLALLVALVPIIFELSHKLLAEIPALAFATLALAAIEALRRDHSPRHARLWTATLVAACAVAVLMRGNSLALVPALAVAIARRGSSTAYRWRCAAGLAAAVAVFGMWTLRNSAVQYAGIDNVTYLEEVQATDPGVIWSTGGIVDPQTQRAGAASIARRVYENVAWFLAYNVADAVLPGAGILREIATPGLGLGLALLLAAPIFIGLWPYFRASPAGATYLLGSLALIIIYPTGGATRMLAASVPTLLAAQYFGLRLLGGVAVAQGWAVAAACAGLIACVAAGERQKEHPYSFDGFAAVVSLLDEANVLGAGDRVALVSDYPQAVKALTTLRTVTLSEAVEQLRAGEEPAFLFLDGGSPSPAGRVARPGDLVYVRVAERGDYSLWRVQLVTGSGGR